MLLAVFAGLAAAGLSVREDALARLLAALTAFCGGRALYETLWGLPAWAAAVRESATAADALAANTARNANARLFVLMM